MRNKIALFLCLFCLALGGFLASASARITENCQHYCAYIDAYPYWCGSDHVWQYAYVVQTGETYRCEPTNHYNNDYDWYYQYG